MLKKMKCFLLIVSLVTLIACEGSDSAYDRGYGDGYARGYNSLCYPNASNIIYGDFDNQNYSRGYNDGKRDGRNDCRAER